MRISMFGAAMLASTLILLMGSRAGAADARYDRKLAQAAAEIVAERMGPLRGGFSVDEKPALLTPMPAQTVRRPVRTELPPPAPGEWRDGLAIAVEKKSVASPEL